MVLAKLRRIKATIPPERAFKDAEDVRAILEFTEIDVDILKRRARKNNTIRMFEDLLMEKGR